MVEELPGFVLAALALTGSPGPAVLSLAAVGAAFGFRDGVGYMAGIVAGMGVVIALVASGLVGIVLALPGAVPAVTVLATLYFVYLAWRIATAPPIADTQERRDRPSFTAGFLLSMVNPKGYAAMAALFSGFILARASLAADVAAKTVVLAVIIVAVNVAWLSAGAALTRRFRDPRSSRAINVTFAILLLVSVAVAALA